MAGRWGLGLLAVWKASAAAQNAGGRRKVGRAGAAMIAAAVEALVVAEHQGRDGFTVPAQYDKRALATIGMKPRRVGFARR